MKKPTRAQELAELYPAGFYDGIAGSALRSAAEILPFVLDLVRPSSVCDFGCGKGAWLSICTKLGVIDILGIDGPQVPQADLLIEPMQFHTHDFENDQKLSLGRHFDLAISLEVAEHVKECHADAFIRSLVAAAPFLLFSAAIPMQGGNGHVNEQWPSYWLRQFESHEYRAYDCIRPIFWDNPRVEWWYAQNTFLIASSSVEHQLANVSHTLRYSDSSFLKIVHPKLFSNVYHSR